MESQQRVVPSSVIRELEELAMNAWPALQTVLYDGWVLRLADGYTKRANSVHPLYFSMIDVKEKLAVCERFYRQRGLRPIFKLTAASQPPELDSTLAEMGYACDSLTIVQELSLVEGRQPGEAMEFDNIELSPVLNEEWLAAAATLAAMSPAQEHTMRRMLESIVSTTCFAALCQDGRIIACALGVQQNRRLGLFDVVVAAAYRRRGFGQALVEAILGWGARNGAESAYLQVVATNSPALALYAKLGFIEVYRYWYRIGSR